MDDIYKMARIQIGIIAIFVLSYSNFCEAIVGAIMITSIGLVLNQRWANRFKFKKTSIYLTATILAAIYVITQEFKIHNLGGNNVYDPYDVLFSVIGLEAAFILLITLKSKVVKTSPVPRY